MQLIDQVEIKHVRLSCIIRYRKCIEYKGVKIHVN